MASRLKVVEPTATELAPLPPIDFTPAPTRKRHAGWTAEKQRKFIDRLALTGSAGQASAAVGDRRPARAGAQGDAAAARKPRRRPAGGVRVRGGGMDRRPP